MIHIIFHPLTNDGYLFELFHWLEQKRRAPRLPSPHHVHADTYRHTGSGAHTWNVHPKCTLYCHKWLDHGFYHGDLLLLPFLKNKSSSKSGNPTRNAMKMKYHSFGNIHNHTSKCGSLFIILLNWTVCVCV